MKRYIVIGKDKDNKVILLQGLYLYSLSKNGRVSFIDEVNQNLLDSVIASPKEHYSVSLEQLNHYELFSTQELDKWNSYKWTLKEVLVSKFFFTNDTDLGFIKCLGLYFYSDSGSLVARRFIEDVGPVRELSAYITKEEMDKAPVHCVRTCVLVNEPLDKLYGKGFILHSSDFIHPM